MVVACGLVLGLGGSCASYTPHEDIGIVGIPIPLAVFQRTNGRWIDYLMPPPLMLLFFGLNLLLASGIVHGIASALGRSQSKELHNNEMQPTRSDHFDGGPRG